ncbi:MAG: GNAT family N-acetyltransferase [Verrucomicrobia bacterium]|nr:GNAT family N-acetyltransferase [Verrucomicrobiota bacterium]
MSAAVTYRPMTPADLEPARRLWSETEGVELAEGDSVGELTHYLRRNPGLSFVAIQDGQLVGAVLGGHDGRRGFLYHLSVAARARGAGIGRELAQRSLATLREAGLTRVLILVARDNHLGRQFWQRQGWEALEFAEPMGIDL